MASDQYAQARSEAQAAADRTGFDYGIEHNALFKDYRVFMLPQKTNRRGHELRCEVVSCSDLAGCRPGHGPC